MKKFLIGAAASALMLGTTIIPAFAAGSWYVDPLGNDANTCLAPGASTACLTIQGAIIKASSGDTINVAAGTYTEVGQIVINRDLTIIGADKTTTIIKPDQDTGNPGSGDARGWFLTSAGITFNMSGVTLDGAGKNICHGIYDYSLGTIQDINVKNISCEQYYGRAIYLRNNSATVRNVRLENIERIGVYVFQGAPIIDGITYVGKGSGNHLDYGIELENGAVATITNNTISNNTGVALSDGSTSAGILVTTYFGPGTQATITGNTLTNNTDGIAVGYDGSDASVVTAYRNSISGNSASGVTSTNPAVNATCNWWGASNGPGPVGPGSGDKVSIHVDYSPWLVSSNLSGPCIGGNVVTRKDQCKNDGWKNFTDANDNPFKNQGKCIDYVEHHNHKVNGNVKYAANGLSREVEFDMNTADNNGTFSYTDANKDSYKVKVSSVNVNGHTAWFAGVVTKSKNNAHNGQWFFAKVFDNSPDQISGSFTNQITAEAGVINMTDPTDGPFNVTRGNLRVN